VTDLQGQVEVRKSSTAPFAAATLGQVLQVGASLRTGDRGQATLQLIEGSIIRVTENTAFELTDLSGNQNNPKTVLGLDFGTLFVFAAKALGLSQFDIQTPSGVASVRGSYFSVKYSQGTIIVTCLESSAPCDFSTLGNSVTLRNGDKAVIDNLKFVLRVERMSQEDLSDFLTALPQAATILRTAFPSGTPTAGSTSTPTPTPTVFPSDTPTFGPVLIPVSTFTPTPTSTPTPTPTATCVPGVTVPCP
jgi:ferric-dicitrate binding protein FerR (iron transport regulator)